MKLYDRVIINTNNNNYYYMIKERLSVVNEICRDYKVVEFSFLICLFVR